MTMTDELSVPARRQLPFPTLRPKSRGVDVEWVLDTVEVDDGGDCTSRQALAVLTVTHHGRADYVGPIEYAFVGTLKTVIRENFTRSGGGSYSMDRYSLHDGAVTIFVEGNVPRYSRRKADAVVDEILRDLPVRAAAEERIAAIFDRKVS